MKTPERPCPQCGSIETKRIVWTEDDAKLASAASAGVAYVRGPWVWNQHSDIDRVCVACEKRFCNDPAVQARYDEDSRRQKARIEAQKRGDYLLFDPRMSTDDIADAVIRKYKLFENGKRPGEE